MLYVDDNKAQIGISGNRFHVTYPDGLLREIPIKTVDNVTILGNAQMTTQATQACLKNGIPVTFFSKGGNILADYFPPGMSILCVKDCSVLFTTPISL